jgi:hypothetical protein
MVTYEYTRGVEVFEGCHVLDFEAYSYIFQTTENIVGVSAASYIVI